MKVEKQEKLRAIAPPQAQMRSHSTNQSNNRDRPSPQTPNA
ncbi:hypothetical protein [Nostoc sp.]